MSTTTLRSVAFLVVLGAHTGLLIILSMLHGRALQSRYEEPSTVFLLLPSNSSDEAGAALRPVRPTAAASRVRKETSNDIPPVQVPTAPQDDSSAPIAIDWAREADLAATRRLRADEEAARRATAFSARKGPSLAVAKPLPPKFGWSHAQTQRVESVPGVGTLINLNDRCAILITFMLIPICKLGKIDARGDLFEHMDDPAPLGESLRELP